MNCRGVQRLLSAYVDRELRGDEMLEVRTHLASCESCQKEADGLRDLKRLLCGVESHEPSIGFEDRLVASVLNHRATPERKAPFSWGRSLALMAGVAACSMAATLIVLSGLSRNAPVAAQSNGDAIAREIQRDRLRSMGTDPYGGAPVITAATYGEH